MKKLTKKLAIKEVEKIKAASFDDEAAHSMEDKLRGWFIECVAKSIYDEKEAAEIANILKSTDELNFARWCA